MQFLSLFGLQKRIVKKHFNMNRINQFLLAVAVAVLGIAMLLIGLKIADQSKRITCLERGMVYVGDEFCGR